jgi:L-alanine-DL-glutamate epimerase-like enolase superfamily enzyme
VKITRVEATTHRVPVQVPLLAEPLSWPFVFVRVETDAGLTGYGLTGPLQRFATRELINGHVASILVGRDPLPPSATGTTSSGS